MLYHIYKITVGDKIYIGSTKDPKDRWIKHKCSAKESSTHAHYQIYVEMRLIGIDNCVFEVLYEIDCIDKTEARKAEQLEIDKHPKEILLNALYAYRPDKEYMKEYMKEYDKTDKRKEYKKEYAKTDKYKEYQKEYKKEYANRPEVKERKNRQARERRAKKKLELKPISVGPNDTSTNIIGSPNDTQ